MTEPDTSHRAHAASAMRIADELGEVEDRTIHSQPLNLALDPLRPVNLRAICGSCRKQVAWCALDASSAYVATFQHRRKPRDRQGGIANCQPPAESDGSTLDWIALAESGKTNVTIEEIHARIHGPGYPLRLRLTCPSCHAEYVSRNTSRLRDFLATIAGGSDTIRL